MPFQRTRYCFRIARSDHAFGSITEWMSSIAQRPRSQTRSYRISFSRSDLRTQLSGVSVATTLACEASRESVLTVNLLTSSPCEFVATSKSTAPSSSFVLRAWSSHFAHSAVSALENHFLRRAPSSHSAQRPRDHRRRSRRRSGRGLTGWPAPRLSRESEDA